MSFIDRFRRKQPARSARGASGRGHYNGFIVPEEANAELIGRQGLRKFDRMWRTDPDVRRVVSMAINPLISATVEVDPYGGDEAEARDVEAAEATKWALLNAMRPKLPAHLAQVLPVLVRSGFAPCEQVWTTAERESKTLLVPKTLGLRLPRTIHQWFQEGEELTGIKQLLDTGGWAEIPAEDLVYYRVGAEGDNWEGTSLLRSVYKPWYFKDGIERFVAIKAEREATGIPTLYPPKGATPEQLDEMEEVLQGLRTAEQAFVIMPGPKAEHLPEEIVANEGWTLDIVHQGDGTSSGKGDLIQFLEYYKDAVAGAFLTDFMRLGQGQTSVGARATADVQQDPFTDAVEALGFLVATSLQESVVERFVALNFEVDEPPTLRLVLQDDAIDLTALADFIQKLTTAKAMVADEPLEDFLREYASLPPADPEERKRAAEVREAARQQILNPPEPAPAEPAKPGEPPRPAPPPAPQKQPPAKQPPAKQPPAKADDQDVVSRLDRELRWWESVMALDEIESAINQARERFEKAGGDPARAAVRDLVTAAIKGREPKLAPPKELTMVLGDELGRLYDTGRSTVALELGVQRKGAPAPAVADLGDGPAELGRRARLAAQSIVQRVWQAVSRSALAKPGDEAAAQAAGEDEARAALRAEAQLHASAAVNNGRQDEADAHSDEIKGARYTSILDANRCDSCAAADDDVLRPLSDPVRLTRRPPNRDCYGGGRCRCMEFYELHDEAAGHPGHGTAPPSGTTEVHQRFPFTGTPEQAALVSELLDAIAAVHKIPEDHPTVPVEVEQMRPGALGRWDYAYSAVTGEILAEQIVLSAAALRRRPPYNSAVHEIGHSLDAHGLGAGVDGAMILQDKFYSSTSAMAEWRQAVEGSAAYAQLQAERPGYLLKIPELWARSYEQWIAQHSGNRQLLAKLAGRNAEEPGCYWSDEDFGPIAAAMDRVFEARGLLA